MAEKKMVQEITAMDVDFAQWYTDIVKKADLIDYSSVKGCMIIRPYGYAIWENIQKILDTRFKELGHDAEGYSILLPSDNSQTTTLDVFGCASIIIERLCLIVP